MDMVNVETIAFEKLIVDTCNQTPISNRVKYYVLKDIAQKLLEASEFDYKQTILELEKKKKEETDATSV